jgi:hypothetical protein
MNEPIDLTKVDLSKLLPPPGVPCRNEQERDLLVMLHNAKIANLEINPRGGWVKGQEYMANQLSHEFYRLPPTPPMRFERVTLEKFGDINTQKIEDWILKTAMKMKKSRLTIVVEEIQE